MHNPTGVKPLLNQILIRLDKVSNVTEGGVHLPDGEAIELNLGNYAGFLVDCGPDCFPRDKFGDRRPAIGDKVFFRRYSGENAEIERDGERYRIMTDECLCGIMREPTEDNETGVLPLLDRTLVRVERHAEKIGSIIIPDAVREDRKWYADKGDVVAMAPNAFPHEFYPAIRPHVGGKVLFAKHGGINYEHGGAFYRVLREQEILAIIN